uniref:Chemokine interleukin-8-like domain-containing protein n=1 Tax=Sinocyclocheilus rhinocerous TaxID=307959 RepID=A0A673JWZ4_9TELE
MPLASSFSPQWWCFCAQLASVKVCVLDHKDAVSPFRTVLCQSKKVAEYSMTSQQCPKEAVLFKTVKGYFVCARPTDSWVKGLIKIIDSRNIGSQGTL